MVRIALFIVMLIGCLTYNVSAQVAVKKIDYKGWKDCYEMSNPLVKLVVVPRIGGRIMEYSILGENVMWQGEGELGVVKPSDVGKKWHNYGGYKAWNSPQAKWTSPNVDNYYDYAPAKAEVIPGENPGIRITCAPVDHLGFQYVREIYMDDFNSHVRIVETMKNIVNQEIEWGVWDVTQVTVPCWVAFPINDNSRFTDGWSIMYNEGEDTNQFIRAGNVGIKAYTGVRDKVGTDATDGWLVYFNDRLAYVKQWQVVQSDNYPDGGCTTEIFTSMPPIGDYVELEVMGPVVKLKPGEQTQLIVDWYLAKHSSGPKSVDDVINGLSVLKKQAHLPKSARIQ